MKTKSSLLVISFTLALATLPAYAQLGGALGSTLGAGARAGGNSTGTRGDLGLNQTLNGSLTRGNQGFGADAASATNATANINRKSNKKTSDVQPVVSDAAGKTNATLTSASSHTVQRGGEITSASAAKVNAATEKTAETMHSSQISASGQGSAQTNVNSSPGDRSVSSNLSASKNVNASLGDKHAEAGANADANSQTAVKSRGESERAKGAAASNSNSGSAKLHGLDRAESRVDNSTALDAIERNEGRQASTTMSSEANTSVKASRKPKR